MIDEIKKEEGKEDDDIIVELPEDLDETENAKESEESTEEDAEVIEEESETEDEAEPEVEETSEEAEAEVKEDTKDNKVFGKRAEKRIKRLVAQKKELEEKLKGYEDEKETWLTERDQLKTKQADSELDAINQYMERLESQEKQALSVLKTAKEASDVDAEIKATDVLASVKAERLVAKQYKARAEKGLESKSKSSEVKETEKKPDTKLEQPLPDRKALAWQKRNSWFGGNKTADRIKTQAALVIHKELIDEGIAPQDGSEEYYSELDARLMAEFPEMRKRTARKIPTVVGGTRSTTGKRKVRLSKSEIEMADRLNVSYDEYARQKLRQTEAGS
jgi:chromosome segregation ATPase